jgi:hypothetical protein
MLSAIPWREIDLFFRLDDDEDDENDDDVHILVVTRLTRLTGIIVGVDMSSWFCASLVLICQSDFVRLWCSFVNLVLCVTDVVYAFLIVCYLC